MAIRYLKILLVALVGLMALLYALQNIVNAGAAFQAVAAALGMADHEYYPSSLGPAVTAPALVWTAVAIIVAGELAVAFLAAKGAWDLWSARRASPQQFNAAKTCALLGCGAGIVVWFGFFGVLGGAYFQMWQTGLGSMSLEGAFQYFASCAFILLFVNMPDD